MELWGQSERNDPGPLFFDSYSFPPRQLPGLIFPYFFGGALLPPYRVGYWGAEIAAIMSGYVGLLTWLLAVIAIFGAKQNRRVWLWLGIAVVSITLAFGGHLPFELNHKLYQIPGYKTFRGLYRHQFEFTFAMAMLAGFGFTSLSQLAERFKRRAFWLGTATMTGVVMVVAILYRFFGDALASIKRPPQAAALTNPEFFVPLLCFLLSVVALWLSQLSRRKSGTQIAGFKSGIANFALIAVLLLDLASYGHFFHWRIATFDVNQRLSDPPVVAFIKSRETDLNSFRVMSYPAQAYDYAQHWPEDPNFDLLNQPNTSMLRGLQSISGYDVLRPARVGEITGTAGSVLNGLCKR